MYAYISLCRSMPDFEPVSGPNFFLPFKHIVFKNFPFIKWMIGSIGRASDSKSEGQEFDSLIVQFFFVLFFISG